MQFTGKTEARMDAKGRLFFPADYRRQFDDGELRFVLKRDAYQPCLVIYPYAAWEEEVGELRARLNRWNPQEAMVFRQFMSDVEVFSLDAAGRFIVPKRFMPLFGDERKVAFLGLSDRIEVWPATTASAFMSQEDFSRSLEELMSK
ncbi:MAG: cell division/cell wall cluster transcriptional repressor MraZ [Alloprevotella sp.]|nr:cell division/cell wall cluster transcriptional repressor MraZ [Alloprevotella sp.]